MAPQPITFQDYLQLPDDGRRREVLAGDLLVWPAPDLGHQLVSQRLCRELEQVLLLAGDGKVVPGPFPVRLSDADFLLPDLFLLLPDRLGHLGPRWLQGPPDLLAECLPPAGLRGDPARRRECYARAGLQEYWLVDPVAGEVEQYVLAGGELHFRGSARDDLPLQLLPGACLDLRRVW